MRSMHAQSVSLRTSARPGLCCGPLCRDIEFLYHDRTRPSAHLGSFVVAQVGTVTVCCDATIPGGQIFLWFIFLATGPVFRDRESLSRHNSYVAIKNLFRDSILLSRAPYPIAQVPRACRVRTRALSIHKTRPQHGNLPPWPSSVTIGNSLSRHQMAQLCHDMKMLCRDTGAPGLSKFCHNNEVLS